MKESVFFLDAAWPGLHTVNQNGTLQVEGNVAEQCKSHVIPSAVEKHLGGHTSVRTL